MEEQEKYQVVEVGNHGVVNFEEYAMTTDSVVRQVNKIQEIMRGVMKHEEHYGTIPGTNKPSLYKPGAEKLSLVFRLRPEYQIKRTDMANGHREYEVTCELFHIPTGQSVGQGVGSATTMEGKYRYRGGEKEGTGNPIPKEYWNLKNAGKVSEAKALIGGDGFAPGKINGKWEICSIGEKQEHDNPADYYNTVLKMAKKRAHVDAILTATAASDIFTQDIEDMPEVFQQPPPPTVTRKGENGNGQKPPADEPITPGQLKAIQAALTRLKVPNAQRRAYCAELLQTKPKSSKELTKAEATALLEVLMKQKPEASDDPAEDVITPEDVRTMFEHAGYDDDKMRMQISTILHVTPRKSIEEYNEQELKTVYNWMIENEG